MATDTLVFKDDLILPELHYYEIICWCVGPEIVAILSQYCTYKVWIVWASTLCLRDELCTDWLVETHSQVSEDDFEIVFINS